MAVTFDGHGNSLTPKAPYKFRPSISPSKPDVSRTVALLPLRLNRAVEHATQVHDQTNNMTAYCHIDNEVTSPISLV